MEHTKVILVVILLSLVVVSAGCLHGTDTSPQNQTNVTDDETNQTEVSEEANSSELPSWLKSGNYNYTLETDFFVENRSTDKVRRLNISSEGVRNNTGEFVQTKEFEFENGSRQLVSEYSMRATDDYIEITVDNETERIEEFDNGTPTPGTTYNVSVGNRTQWTYNTFHDENLEIIRKIRRDDPTPDSPLDDQIDVYIQSQNFGPYLKKQFETVTGRRFTEESLGIRVGPVSGRGGFGFKEDRNRIWFTVKGETLEGVMLLRIHPPKGVDDVDFSEFFRRGV